MWASASTVKMPEYKTYFLQFFSLVFQTNQEKLNGNPGKDGTPAQPSCSSSIFSCDHTKANDHYLVASSSGDHHYPYAGLLSKNNSLLILLKQTCLP